jgi:hypothetical protein
VAQSLASIARPHCLAAKIELFMFLRYMPLSETVEDLDSDFIPPLITADAGRAGQIIADRTRTYRSLKPQHMLD